MKNIVTKSIITLIVIHVSLLLANAQVAINMDDSNPDASAMLDVSSTDKGVLIPRMTSMQRTNINNPATGLLVFDNETKSFWFYNGVAWKDLSSTSDADADPTNEIELPIGGNDGQVLQTDGNGNYTWTNKTIDTDNQTLSLANDNLSISDGNTIALNSAFLSNNGLTYGKNTGDNFLFGTNSLDHASGDEYKLFFNKEKGAFRVGKISNTNWDNDNLGVFSFAGGSSSKASGGHAFAFGSNVIANGDYATAFGQNNTASGQYAAVFGNSNTASGNYTIAGGLGVDVTNTFSSAFGNSIEVNGSASAAFGNFQTVEGSSSFTAGQNNTINNSWSTAFGLNNTTNGMNATAIGSFNTANGDFSMAIGRSLSTASFGETALGLFNTEYTPNDAAAYHADDRLFVIGNGTSNSDRSDALRIYKNGNMELNGALTIDEAYTLPVTDGTLNQVLTTDGTGTLTWSDPQTFTDTDNQTIDVFSLVGDNLQLSLENDEQSTQSVDLSSFKDNTDNQELSLSNNTLSISGGSNTVSLSSYLDNTDNQELTLSNNTLSISGGANTVSLSSYLDNTDNQELTLSDNTLSISGSANTVSLDSYLDNTDNQTVDKFNLSGTTLQLSLEEDGQSDKTVDLSSFMDNTDAQTLSLSNDNISISGGNSITLNSAFIKNNGVTYSTNTSDDFLFGASSLNHTSGSERKILFDDSKGAFRAGTVTGSDWDEANIGLYSTALGWNVKASAAYTVALGYNSDATDSYAVSIGNANVSDGLFSVAMGSANESSDIASVAIGASNDVNGRYSVGMGDNNVVNGEYAVVMGSDNTTGGNRSSAIGYGLRAPSYGEVVLGFFNHTYTADNSSIYDADDRLFVLGNGLNTNSRSDAIRIFKDGRSYFYGDAVGTSEFVMTVDNTTNNNNNRNNGLLIKVGHSTYNSDNRSSFVEFESPDGDYCGRIRQTGNASVSFQNTSDIRLKENIRPTQYGLEDILNIEVKDYNYKTDPVSNQQTGFIAQQLHTVFPTVVEEGGEDAKTKPWSVDYAGMTPLLVKGVQDQQALIEQQDQRIRALNDKIERLEKENEQLKAQVAKINQLETMLYQLQSQIQQSSDNKTNILSNKK